MKNKNKLFAAIASLALGTVIAAGAVACTGQNNNDNKAEHNSLTAKEVYAVSAFSGASYLNTIDEGVSNVSAVSASASQTFLSATTSIVIDAATANLNKETATERPSDFTDENVQGIKNCLNMFDSLLLNGGIEQSIEKNEQTGVYGEYTFVMTMKAGEKQIVMYYNEISSETKTEIDEDDNEEEIETSTTLKGVLLFGENVYEVDGKKELETEGDESEYSVEFTTKKDDGNYVKFSYATEKEKNESELSYECKIYKNHKKVSEIELEIEEENGVTDIKFKLKTAGNKDDASYKIVKKEGSDKFDIRHEYNGKKSYITAEKTQSGYVFLYSNGYSENVGF